MSNSALERVMGQAEDAAKNYTPSDNTSLATTGGNAVAQRTSTTSSPSLSGIMDNGGITVDMYLQLKYEGFKVSAFEGLFDADIRATIDLSEIVPIFQIRSTKNGSTEFYKSYNGYSTPDGQNFGALKDRLEQGGASVTGPYETAEIPFVTKEDITIPGKAGGKVEAGTRIGTTPPITGTKNLSAFLKAVRNAGISEQSTVDVTLQHQPKKNNKGNAWGIVGFVLNGEADEAE